MKHLLIILSLAVAGTSYAHNQPNNTIRHDNPLMQIMISMHKGMMEMKATNDPDDDFAMMMKMHHQGAIKMADYELSNGKNAEMKAMAKKMKEMQQMEIEKLESFLKEHEPAIRETAFTKEAHMAMDAMMKKMDPKMLTGNVDHDFAVLMISHHQSALDMSQSILKHGVHKQIKDMAAKMIADQKMEVAELEAWHKMNRK